MMKKITLILTALLLAACSSKPNLVHTQQPILNISAELHPLIEAEVSSHSAWIKNKTGQNLGVKYDLFWYTENGVTQPVSTTQDQYSATLLLTPLQKQAISLTRPTPESVNYRLYLRLQ
ncbi:hypothetical protein ACT2CV_04420 [Pasteurellaceae bacterium 22721_9_1]